MDKMNTNVPSIKGFITLTIVTLNTAHSAEIDGHIAAFIARGARPISTVGGKLCSCCDKLPVYLSETPLTPLNAHSQWPN